MQCKIHLVTGTEIEGSDLFGDIQSIVKSLTTIWNSFRHIGDARRQGKQTFPKKCPDSGQMSGIRDTCPEYSGHDKTPKFCKVK